MNAESALDVVDDYVDQLLDPGPPPDAAGMRADAGLPEASDAVAADAEPPPAAPEAPATPVAKATPAPAVRPALPAQPPTPLAAPPPGIAPQSAPQTRPQSASPSAREPMRDPAAPAQRWVRVAVGADSYALELLCVQEVVRLAPIVAMRGAAAAVLGVMNLRGRIVPVFDLGLWLGRAPVQPDAGSRIVVVERDDELIGVLVSAVDDVVTLSHDRIEPPVPGADPGPTLGVARVGAAPTVLLDAGALYG